jgi:murein L,D-transpeptidase YafK
MTVAKKSENSQPGQLTKEGTSDGAINPAFVSSFLKAGGSQRPVHDNCETVIQKVKAYFLKAEAPFPPVACTIVCLKAEKRIELYAARLDHVMVHIKSYQILSTNNRIGPRVTTASYQVPEGIYRFTNVVPAGKFHMGLPINFPNTFDRRKARESGMIAPGGRVMIHGNCVSIGGVAIGNQAIEEVSAIAAFVGLGRIKVVIAPFDLRKRSIEPAELSNLPAWTLELYDTIQRELIALKKDHWGSQE